MSHVATDLPENRQEAMQPHQPKATILVVEDDVDVLELAHDFLILEGYQVRLATDAEQALASLNADEGVDLLFSDVRMPGKFDGLTLARKVRELWPTLKILLTTGFDLKIFSENDGDDFPVIQKPYFPDSLNEHIQAILSGEALPTASSLLSADSRLAGA